MAEQHAVPEQESDKKQGDKLDNVVGGASDKSAGLTEGTSGKDAQTTPQDEPLK